MPRHRAAEFRRFLDTVEKNVPGDLDIHVVMDNASSHKTKLIRDWFAKRPRLFNAAGSAELSLRCNTGGAK
jgi:transposase